MDLSCLVRAVVETGAGSLCYTSKQVNVTGTSGYLSSLITAESGFGSEACPWVIRVDSGQRINITLLDFTLATAKTNGYNEVQEELRYSKSKDLG